MRIISWNINSVRLRLALLQTLSATYQPDVLCLQETKCPQDAFPSQPLAEIGFTHQICRGFKGYNGVAILSRFPFSDSVAIAFCDLTDARHIAVRMENIWLHNLYVPSGGDVADSTQNPKFGHKLRFLEALTPQLSPYAGDRTLVVGDLNVAPRPEDVWNHQKFVKERTICHTPEEISRYETFVSTGGWRDVVKEHCSEAPVYSWWSYRNHDWQRSNKGRRIDHALASPALAPHVCGAHYLTEVRNWETTQLDRTGETVIIGPSDHAPLCVDLTA